ncbi:MAG: Base plate wedge protein 53, partial [Bacteroidota bacterium]
EHRADLISNLFYNTPTLDWLVCLSNNINDPFQQLNVGDEIKILKLL